MENNFRSKQSNIFSADLFLKNAVSMVFCLCIWLNGVGRLVQCDQGMNATRYFSLLQQNVFESVGNIHRDQEKSSLVSIR